MFYTLVQRGFLYCQSGLCYLEKPKFWIRGETCFEESSQESNDHSDEWEFVGTEMYRVNMTETEFYKHWYIK